MRGLLHEGSIGRRAQYRIETLLKIEKGGFADYPSITDADKLDFWKGEDRITFDTDLDDSGLKMEDDLDRFRYDEDYGEGEEEWAKISGEILGENWCRKSTTPRTSVISPSDKSMLSGRKTLPEGVMSNDDGDTDSEIDKKPSMLEEGSPVKAEEIIKYTCETDDESTRDDSLISRGLHAADDPGPRAESAARQQCEPASSRDNKAPAVTNVVTARRHHVEMTLFGAVCFHPGCTTRLGRSFRVSHQTLRTHFDKAQCYTGDFPDCTNLARDLYHDLSTHRELVQKGGASADVLVERVLPVNYTTRSTASYCLKCGLVGKPSALNRQHYTDQNKKCSPEHLRTGTIVKSSVIRRMKIPDEVVSLIRQGKFVFGKWNDPKEKRIAGLKELTCQTSGVKRVSTTTCPPSMYSILLKFFIFSHVSATCFRPIYSPIE